VFCRAFAERLPRRLGNISLKEKEKGNVSHPTKPPLQIYKYYFQIIFHSRKEEYHYPKVVTLPFKDTIRPTDHSTIYHEA
jgi:hypothetical protein